MQFKNLVPLNSCSNLVIIATLLKNIRKLKFYRFESEQNLVSFIDLNIFFFYKITPTEKSV